MQENGEFVLIVSTVLILIIVIALVILFTTFQKKKNTLIKERKIAKEQFERTIAETQIEIREETLRNISWELHDNIGQLLTLAKIQLQSATPENITEVSKTITQGLTEVRALSKLINPEAIKAIEINEALQLEIDRFNRLQFIASDLRIIGDPIPINEKASIIIFRILQEFFSNTIKHSKASHLNVSIEYTQASLKIIAKDDGVGFKTNGRKDGIGLTNIKNRAKLIGADAIFTSELNKGTMLQIDYEL